MESAKARTKSSLRGEAAHRGEPGRGGDGSGPERGQERGQETGRETVPRPRDDERGGVTVGARTGLMVTAERREVA